VAVCDQATVVAARNECPVLVLEVGVSAGATGVCGWPFGVGVLIGGASTADAGGREEDRLAVALAAYKAGYFLLGTFDLAVEESHAAAELDRLRALVLRTDAGALFIHGEGGPASDVLEETAAQLRLAIWYVDGVAEAVTTTGARALIATVTRSN
jgi:hypothetical protein